jgi:hypothetical protein
MEPTINEYFLLKYTNFEYLLYKRLFGEIFPKKLLKEMYLKKDFKYTKSTIQSHFEVFYNLLIKSEKVEKSELLEDQFEKFLKLINDEAEVINTELNEIHIKKKQRLHLLSKIKREKKRQKLAMVQSEREKKIDVNLKPFSYKFKSGYKEVNDFVLDLIDYQKELGKVFDQLDELYQRFFISFIYCVLYKDIIYNLFVNKASNLKKIGFLNKKFQEMRNENLDILFYKFKKDCEEKKIEEKICRKNKKIISILKAIDSNDIGKIPNKFLTRRISERVL